MVVSFRLFSICVYLEVANWQIFFSVQILIRTMPKFFSDKSEKVTNTMGTFKQRKSLATRKEEVENIRAKFPTKIPVIVERFPKETQLPVLDKTKFLVPQELAISQFLTIIRNRMHLGPTQAFYLLINNKNLASMSKTIAEVYLENKDEDGFLYVTYASQEMFGSSIKVPKQACV